MTRVSNGKRVYTRSEKRMIGKVVHLLCLMGYTDDEGNADKDRINEYIKGIGSNNPRQVILPFLYEEELEPIVTQIEARYRKEVKEGGR